MDTKFQTSFIPKKSSIVEQKIIRRSHSNSILTFVAVLIFIASIAGAAYSFIWKNVLLKSQESFQTALKDAEQKFDTKLIDDLRRASSKIEFSEELLKNHLAVSEVFAILSGLTIEGVKFNSFEFSGVQSENTGVEISLEGVGNSFSAIAYQSDVFGQSTKFGTNKALKNPVVSDLQLQENGSVKFTFSATLDPADLSYEKILVEEIGGF